MGNRFYIRVLGSLLAGFVLLPFFGMAQKIKTSQYDKDANKGLIETLPLNLKMVSNTKMDAALKMEDTALTLRLTGWGIGTNTLDEGSQLVILLDNDSSVVLLSPSVQAIDYSVIPLSYSHDYTLTLAALETLSRHGIKSVRKFSAGGHDDISIERKNMSRLKDLSNLFYQELKKTDRQTINSVSAIIQPAFPGGTEALVKFLNRNFQYPVELREGEQKKLAVEFLVRADGNASNFQLPQQGSEALNDEVLRILRRMPKWKPGLQNGKAVDVAVKKNLVFSGSGALLKIDF